nr:glutaredoxin family protein [Propionibacterium sp.]
MVVVTRTGCHLCEEAERVAAAVCREAGASWSTLDVDADADLRARFSDHVPVTFVDGVRFALWFLDPDALRAALQ